MRRFLLASTILVGLTGIASADAINNLSISALPNPVPQSISNPCIICGTTAPGQPGNFGYNNFSNHGSDTSFSTFSTNIIGGGVLVGDLEVNALPYSGALLQALAGAGLTFGVAIDVNTAQGGETLTGFRLIDLDKAAGSRIIFDFSGTFALPDINNGNGKGDYLITGFNLGAAGVAAGDRLIFQASWTGASDGAESFYIVPTIAAVPGPIAGAGIPGLVAGLLGMFGLSRRRRNRSLAA